MRNRLRRFQKLTFVLGAAAVTFLWVPCPVHAQSSTSQDRQAVPAPPDRQTVPGDDITRRDLAQFDQFLDGHREVADQLRKTPSLIDDPQYLQSHPELNAYLQDHTSVKQEISQQPDTFMRLEDVYARDHNLRDRDAAWQDRDANRGDMNRDRDGDRRDVANFNRFLDDHREIDQQVRRDPSLLDNQKFVQDHPALQTYFQDNPGVRDQLRQNPNAFMHQEDAFNRDANMRDRDASEQGRDPYRNDVPNRDNDRRDVANFDRFLDDHREIAQQVRKDPSLLDNQKFVQDHPALQTYFQDNPGVRDQIKQDPNSFMRQEDAFNRDSNMRDRDPMRDHMADFGGFLHSHSDIQDDLSRNPSAVKDHEYVQNHPELYAYLNAHPDVQAELMANPDNFVHGAQQYNSASPSGTSGSGAGVKTGSGSGTGSSSTGAGTGTTGTGADSTPTSTNPTTPHQSPKPNQ
jgi:hypothetical protein